MSAVRSVMSPEGGLNGGEGNALHRTQLLEFYRLMVLARELEHHRELLHRDGRISFHVPTRDFDAAAIGAACAAAPGDWVFASWPWSSVALARDVSATRLFNNLLGNASDPGQGHQGPGNMGFAEERIVPVSSPTGTHLAQAVGMAMGASLRKSEDLALCFFGSAAQQSPDFHSSLNFAAVMEAPVVFITDDEQDRGMAYGISDVHVDGRDIVATYLVVAECCAKARDGGGPQLIHTRLDDRGVDPLKRLGNWLIQEGHGEENLLEAMAADARHVLRQGEAAALSVGCPDAETLFRDVTETQTCGLERQARAMKDFRAEYGGDQDPDADFILG